MAFHRLLAARRQGQPGKLLTGQPGGGPASSARASKCRWDISALIGPEDDQDHRNEVSASLSLNQAFHCYSILAWCILLTVAIKGWDE
jgi:hypothetical protein